MKKNMKIFIVMKIEYGAGEENVFSEVLHMSSSKSTAEMFKARYMEEFDESIHKSHSGRWVSIQLHQCFVQIDDEIIAPDYFIRYIDGSDKTLNDSFNE